MKRNGRLPTFVTTATSLVFCALALSPIDAAEVLVNGDLESSVSPTGWSIVTFITEMPGTAIPSVVEHNDGANNPAQQGLGLLLSPPEGDSGNFAGMDLTPNFVLEQIVVGIPGRTYTFKGDAFLQDGYSGIVETLNDYYPTGDYNSNFEIDAADYVIWRMHSGESIELPNESPTPGEVDEEDYDHWLSRFGYIGHPGGPSPTETYFEMAFLNAGDEVIEDPVVFDLRDDTTTLAWRTHELMGVAPVGTAKVRVRAAASDMINNCCDKGQDLYLDNFSLRDSLTPGLERLTNGNLNTPGDPEGWTLMEGPTVDQGMGPITADSGAFIDFANREVASTDPNPMPPPEFLDMSTGQQGFWLRPFVNETQFEPDIPSVDAVLSQVVPGTPGAEYEFSAWSAWEPGYSGGLFGTSTETFLKIEFLNDSMSVVGTQMLDLLDAGQINDDAGNVEYDDWRQFSVNGVAPAGTAHVRVSLGATGMFASGLGLPQSAFFDEMSLIETLPGGGSRVVAVPEPSCAMLLGIASWMVCLGRGGYLASRTGFTWAEKC